MKMAPKLSTNTLVVTERKPISLHVWTRYVLEEREFAKEKKWSLNVVIDELTTEDELRQSWAKILIDRDQLIEFQGSDPNRFSTSLTYALREKKKVFSYSELAHDLNFDLIAYLLWATDSTQGTMHQKAGEAALNNFFNALAFTNNNDIEDYIKNGSEDVINGIAPWNIKTGPITARKVTHILNQFEKKMGNIIILGKANYQEQFDNITDSSAAYWSRAKDLLKKNNTSEWDKYESRYNSRWQEIIDRIKLPLPLQDYQDIT
ncbi:MAG: hypothetical protein WCK35_12775 [Chloroflexota bacterium]